MKTINHECYVSLEVAKLLKEAGFDWECEYVILPTTEMGDMPYQYNRGRTNNYNDKEKYPFEIYSTPTLEVAQRWLREEKEYAVIVETHNVQASCVSAYVYCIYPTDAIHPREHINGFVEEQCFETYEQAQESGIRKALEIILEKGECI